MMAYVAVLLDKKFNLISPETRQILLDPAWNTAPTSLEESLEIGLEMGVD